MPYKPITSTRLYARQDTESAEAIDLLNDYASLRNEPVTRSLIGFLREVLPTRIAKMKRQVKGHRRSEAL